MHSRRANLNTSYFSNRQDRYLQFTAQSRLADYCFSFLQAASTFSYSLLPSSGSTDDYTLHWSHSDTHPHQIEAKAQQALLSLRMAHRNASEVSLVKHSEKGVSDQPDGEDDVLIFPVIQAGQFDIREEERCLSLLFRELAAQQRHSVPPASGYGGPVVDLTSGYFALYKPYQSAVIESRLACRILAASPRVSTVPSAEINMFLNFATSSHQANGFYKSRGVSGRIPEAYTLFERRFMNAVRAAGSEWPSNSSDVAPGVQLHEWQRGGWTYHAKGASLLFRSLPHTHTLTLRALSFAYAASSRTTTHHPTRHNERPGIWVRPTPTSTPALTLFGSTNLNSRSANLDTELSFVLATTSPALRQRLAEEVDGLREHATPWRGQDSSDDDARRVRLGTRALVALVGGML